MVDLAFDAGSTKIGGFTTQDGTIDFYLRVKSLIKHDSIVLDLGAGRASWHEDDPSSTRKSIRLLKGHVKKLIAADIDDIVLVNMASDEQVLIRSDGKLNIPPNSIDVIVADYVLEHIEDVENFYKQVNQCLKKNGWFCARTPHKFNYVALFASIIRNKFHSKVLKYVQPSRKVQDVFPTRYKLNTLKDVSSVFAGWENKSFLYPSEPSYFFGKKPIYRLLLLIHYLLPLIFYGNIFVFVRKT